jgi:iron complex transport system substrate-binding protein
MRLNVPSPLPTRSAGSPVAGPAPAPGPGRRPRRASLLAAASLAVLSLLAACGGADTVAPTPAASGPSAAAASFPVTITGANGPVTLDKAPQRIVSLSPTATEMLFAMGAGSQVVAVDDNSTYPASAPRTKLSAYQPNAEAVAGYDPDLVVLSNGEGGFAAALAKLKLPAVVLPAPKTLAESYQQFTTLGAATGHPDEAAKVAGDVQRRIEAAVASVPKGASGDQPLKVYHELDQTYFSATSQTFIGSVYTLFGLENIADEAKDAAGGYPQLSAEYVVTAAPDLIVLADTKCCGQTPATVAKRPAFAQIPAVKQGRVLPVDDDVASRWGPRTADFAEAVAKVLATGR